METIMEDADEIGWRVAYHNYLCEPFGPRQCRKMEFEEWKEMKLEQIMKKPAPGRVVVPIIADLEAQLLATPEKPSMATQESASRMHPEFYVQGSGGAIPVWGKS